MSPRPLPLLALLLLALPAQAEPLPVAIRQALAQHPEVRTSQAMRNAMDERLAQVRSNYYPSVGVDVLAQDARDLDLGVARDRSTRRADAFLRWNLFRGLADSHSERMSEHELLAADADLDASREQVALQVSQTYLEVLRLRRHIELDEAYLAELRQLDEDVGRRVAAGRMAQADREHTRSGLIQALANQSRLRGQLRGAEMRYRLLVGETPGGLSEPVLDDSAASQDLEALLADALSRNDRLRATSQRAAARGKEVGIAKAALYPRLDLELRRRLYTDIEPVPQTQTEHTTQLVLNYQMPLGGASFSRMREAIQRKEAAQAAMDAEVLNVRSDIAQRWTAWQEARAITPQLVERVAASDRVVQAYDLQFNAGRRSVGDLISARTERYGARVDLLENRVRQLALNAEMLALLGQLRISLLGASTQR